MVCAWNGLEKHLAGIRMELGRVEKALTYAENRER